MQRLLFVFVVIVVALLPFNASKADGCLLNKSSAAISAEVEGLGTPDAKFNIASVNLNHDVIGQIAQSSSVGDQGKRDQLAQSRSTGCSTGCSNGCSVGCSTGCSVGCSMGCR